MAKLRFLTVLVDTVLNWRVNTTPHDSWVAPTKSVNWGQSVLLLRFGGATYSVRGLDAVQKESLSRLYTPLLTKSAEERIVLETEVYQLPCVLSEDPRRYAKNTIYTPLVRSSSDRIAIEAMGFRALLLFEPCLRGALYVDHKEAFATTFVFENYLRFLSAYAILSRGGALIHSAGCVVDEKAYLFLGRSGAGKTTLCRIAMQSGVNILSDDINIATLEPEGTFSVGAVPFAGELGYESLTHSGSYPLKGLYWLEKGDSLRCEEIPTTEQVAKLLACCPVVNVDRYQLDRVLTVIETLLHKIPLRRLYFRREEHFPDISRLLLNEY